MDLQHQAALDAGRQSDRLDFQEMIVPRMKDLIIDSFLSVRNKMNPNKRKNIFELFGFDFMIDEDYRTWLIEINTNPHLGTPSKEMAKLVPRMINEVIHLTVDQVFKPAAPIEDLKEDFVLLYREQAPAVNLRRPYSLDLVYPVARMKPFIGRPEKKLHKSRLHSTFKEKPNDTKKAKRKTRKLSKEFDIETKKLQVRASKSIITPQAQNRFSQIHDDLESPKSATDHLLPPQSIFKAKPKKKQPKPLQQQCRDLV